MAQLVNISGSGTVTSVTPSQEDFGFANGDPFTAS